ncbi:Methionyl-tRNA synthetase [Carabus blaptoides fortunei]
MGICSVKTNNYPLASGFLTGKNATVSDIAVWSILYPLNKDEKLKPEYLSNLNNIEHWFKQLENMSEVKDAVSKYSVSAGSVSYQAVLAGEKYISQLSVGDVKSDTPNLSPSHHVDAITAEELKAAEEAWLNGNKTLPKPKKVVTPVLPVAGEKNILVTSALPYVNNVPHLGNIIGCVLSADVFTRFCRLCNYNTILICGTDEYGTATETKALEEGITPQQICDKYFQIHNDIYRWFGIGFDYFGRTTTPEQTKLCQELFLELHQNGFMQTMPVEQLLCQKCTRYLADRFVEGGCPHPGCGYPDARGDQCDGCSKLINAIELLNPRCKVCNSTPVVKTSHQFFLDLPKLEPLLYHWMEKSSPGWSNNARIIGKTWLREGLKPRCITRDLKWGIPVPIDGYRDKVFYVWFDAPIGYMSITKRYTPEWEKWWKPAVNAPVTLYQFMAKDNVPFHSVMFPAVQLGCNKGFVTVSHIMATEYLNYEDGKFSKSRGIGVFGNNAQDTGIPSDVWRFYLLYVRPESQDSSFSWADLVTKNNSELLNNLGNFINRALVFAEKFFNGAIPEMKPNAEDFTLLAMCTRELKGYISAVEKAKLRDGIRYILSISRHGNQYMQSTQPWVLLKGSVEDKIRAGTVIGLCCNLVCLLATLLHPYMPATSRIIQQQINAPESTAVLVPEKPEIVHLLPAGHKIGKPAPLFNKIDPALVEELKAKYGGQQENNSAPIENVIELEAAIANQGDKVRALKSSGVEKKVWEPEVAKLLDLKKKLAAAQGGSASAKTTPAKGADKKEAKKPATPKKTSTPVEANGVAVDPAEVKRIEQEIEKQYEI